MNEAMEELKKLHARGQELSQALMAEVDAYIASKPELQALKDEYQQTKEKFESLYQLAASSECDCDACKAEKEEAN